MKEAKTTKTINVNNIDQLKGTLAVKQSQAQDAINEYQAMVKASFGPFPKNEIQLVDFILKVMEHSK